MTEKRSYTLILISASLAMLMVKLDAFIVNISLPTIARNFGCSRDIVSLVLQAYLVASTATLLLFGMLGDRIGLKKIYISGFILFTVGSLLALFAFTFLILAFNSFDNRGVEVIMPYGALTIAAFLFYFFIKREKKALHPILDLSLFSFKPLTFVLFASLLASSANFGNAYIMPFYLEKDLGLTSNIVGMLLLISSLVVMVLAPMAGKMSDKINPLKICTIALIVGFIDYSFFSVALGMMQVWVPILFLLFSGTFLGLFLSPNNTMIMSMAAEGKHGIVSATSNTFTSVAAVIGVSVFQMAFSVTTGGDNAHPTTLENIGGVRNAFIIGLILLALALVFTRFSHRSQDRAEAI
jgi:MFS family permease